MLLKISGIKRSTYYYTLSKVNKDMKNDKIMNLIIEIFYKNNQLYGYRRVTLELKRQGFNVNHKKVQRLMKVMGLCAKHPRAKYKSYKGNFNRKCSNKLLEKQEVDNHIIYKRNFKTNSCNQVWSTDVSEFHIAAGKLYLSPILDIHNREIISYNIATSPNYAQIQDMLNNAFERFEVLDNLILHSDQGWQYHMESYHKQLQERNIVQSMSRKGNCLDNSPMENFFGIMKNEMFYGEEYRFKSLEELKIAMEDYIEYYNFQRISLKLKGHTPVEYRHMSNSNI